MIKDWFFYEISDVELCYREKIHTVNNTCYFYELQNPSLCEFPSNIFYDGKLITKESPKWAVKTPLSLWSNPKYPYVFCNTEGEEEYLAYTTEEGNEMSRYNAKEIEHVVKDV